MGEGGEDLGKEIGFKGEARLSIGEGEGERNGWREPVTVSDSVTVSGTKGSGVASGIRSTASWESLSSSVEVVEGFATIESTCILSTTTVSA